MNFKRPIAAALFAALLAGICVVGASGASALVGSASCPGSNATPATASLSALAQTTACLINAERASAGLSTLTSSSQLRSVAERQDNFSIASGKLTHIGDGDIVQRVKATGFLGRFKKFSVGEILASASGSIASPAVIVNAWMSSASHKRVVLFPRFERLGVAAVAGTPTAPGDTSGATFAAVFGFQRAK